MALSPQLRICPVLGCGSNPLKCLPEHLAYAHPGLSAEKRAEFVGKALVFHLPEGHRKMQAVVRIAGRLQLAKKSTCERRVPEAKRRRKSITGDREQVESGDASPTNQNRVSVACSDSFGSSSCEDGRSEDEERDEGEEGRIGVTCTDKSVQCNLMSSALLDRMVEVATRTHPNISAAETAAPRPQYARKSTSCVSNSRAASNHKDREAGELVVRRSNSFTLLKKKVQFPRRSLSPSALCDATPGSWIGEERGEGEEVGSSLVLAPDHGFDCNAQGANNSAPSSELMCKWGDWDVIFFETPQVQPSPQPHQHSVILKL